MLCGPIWRKAVFRHRVGQRGRPAEGAASLTASTTTSSLGLVDGIVMAVAERLEARAILTLDLRDFGAVTLKGEPEIWPRDLSAGPDPEPNRPAWPG